MIILTKYIHKSPHCWSLIGIRKQNRMWKKFVLQSEPKIYGAYSDEKWENNSTYFERHLTYGPITLKILVNVPQNELET